MKRKSIIYKKINTFFYKRTYSDKYKRDDICPLCNKQIIKEDNLYLLINNYKLFPNIFVHIDCVTTKKECVIKLTKSYKEYEDFKQKYIFWEKKIIIINFYIAWG